MGWVGWLNKQKGLFILSGFLLYVSVLSLVENQDPKERDRISCVTSNHPPMSSIIIWHYVAVYSWEVLIGPTGKSGWGRNLLQKNNEREAQHSSRSSSSWGPFSVFTKNKLGLGISISRVIKMASSKIKWFKSEYDCHDVRFSISTSVLRTS